MKIDWVKSIIAIMICALLSYTYYAICDVDELRWLLTVASFITLSITGLFTLGLSLKAEKTSVMMKTFSGIAFFLFLVIDFIFAFINFNIPFFVILNGMLLLIYALVIYSMSKVK